MTSFFPQKKVPECKPEWNREAITVFSKLPSLRRLQATPLLQTSLLNSQKQLLTKVADVCNLCNTRLLLHISTEIL